MAHHGGIKLIKALVSARSYKWSEKVELEIEKGMRLEDIENSISTGCVNKTKKDIEKASIGNKVYVITGSDLGGYQLYTMGKIIKDENGNRIYYFIAAHDHRGK